MENAVVVAGPCVIGNRFGYFGHKVPEGKFAIVEDGEYVNGGHGPCSADGKLYASAERAEEVLRHNTVAGRLERWRAVGVAI